MDLADPTTDQKVQREPETNEKATKQAERSASITHIKDIAAKLAAAKPARWHGRGELLQLPWDAPIAGPVLLIDLWAGMSGAVLALLSLGVRVYVLAAESDPYARAVAQMNITNLVHVTAVEQVHEEMFDDFFARRSVQAVLVGGGSPCQGNSSLNRTRRSCGDMRSHQPRELQRIADGLERRFPQVMVLRFLENVASMESDVRHMYDEIMGAEALRIDAGIFGWVRRNRLYWGAGATHTIASQARGVPQGATMNYSDKEGYTIAWSGKPVPPRLRSVDGFKLGPPVPEQVVVHGGKTARYPFTREFWHPDERTDASRSAQERWRTDGRKFPPGAYEDQNLAWRGEQWRALLAEEKAQLHGMPPRAPFRGDRVKDCDFEEVEKNAHCLIGNGFHIPSLMLVFILLLQAVPAEAVSLHSSTSRTAWHYGCARKRPPLSLATGRARKRPPADGPCVGCPRL